MIPRVSSTLNVVWVTYAIGVSRATPAPRRRLRFATSSTLLESGQAFLDLGMPCMSDEDNRAALAHVVTALAVDFGDEGAGSVQTQRPRPSASFCTALETPWALKMVIPSTLAL